MSQTELKDRVIPIFLILNNTGTKIEKKKKQVSRTRCSNIKSSKNLHHFCFKRRRRKLVQKKYIFEQVMPEDVSPIMGYKFTDIRIQWTSNRIQAKKTRTRYSVIKLLKTKQRGKGGRKDGTSRRKRGRKGKKRLFISTLYPRT